MDSFSTFVGIIVYTIALALCTEVAQYLFVYRTSRFRSLKKNFEKHAQKLEAAKDASTSKSIKKRETRLQGWEGEAGREIFMVQLKTGVVTIASVFLSFRLLPALFGNSRAATLPFHPPAFIMKATQRGLQDVADPRAASPLFVFMLAQACIRPIVSKILAWGPSRRMQQAKPFVPKALKQS